MVALKKFPVQIVLIALLMLAFERKGKHENVFNHYSTIWKIQKAYYNGDDVTDMFALYQLYLYKSNQAKLQAVYLYNDCNVDVNTFGSWHLNDKKTELILDFENNEADTVFEIVQGNQQTITVKDKTTGLILFLKRN